MLVLVAHKYIYDTEVWYLSEFCKLIGMKSQDLQYLERILCMDVLEFDFFVCQEEFYYYAQRYTRNFY